jgi:3-hydroxypropionyl-coenzyme A dehydratase
MIIHSMVDYDVADGVATLTLDDPDRRNALSAEMFEGLFAGLERARGDDAVRCVVLASSHERVWCAGGDLSGFAADVPLVHKHFANERFPDLLELILAFPKPTICAANGHVLAGGTGIALACDLVIAKDTATFGTPEVNIGAFPFMIAALIYRNVPRKQANELIMLGERISAQEAKAAGIFNRVVPGEDFDEAVRETAAKLASKSPLLMRLGKETMRVQMDMSLAEALAYLRAQLTLAQSTDDLTEGVTAFFEKREPVWTGR